MLETSNDTLGYIHFGYTTKYEAGVEYTMAISLQKGQKVDLTKGNAGLANVRVGLGWDEAPKKSSGFFGSLLGGGAANIDCDASVIMLENDKYAEIVYFGKLKSDCSSVVHTGDNLTGEGSGDDEVINVDLRHVPSRFNKLVFVVNIYDCERRKQDFGMIQNAFIRIVNPQNNEELVRFNLSDNYQGFTTLITGELYRHNGEWKFAAVGEGTKDASLNQVCRRFK